MIEDVRPDGDDLGDFAEFVSAGQRAAGAFRCAECRYGISLTGSLPTCPMCGGAVWETIDVPLFVEEPAARA